jgi:hypothetical protein
MSLSRADRELVVNAVKGKIFAKKHFDITLIDQVYEILELQLTAQADDFKILRAFHCWQWGEIPVALNLPSVIARVLAPAPTLQPEPTPRRILP